MPVWCAVRCLLDFLPQVLIYSLVLSPLITFARRWWKVVRFERSCVIIWKIQPQAGWGGERGLASCHANWDLDTAVLTLLWSIPTSLKAHRIQVNRTMDRAKSVRLHAKYTQTPSATSHSQEYMCGAAWDFLHLSADQKPSQLYRIVADTYGLLECMRHRIANMTDFMATSRLTQSWGWLESEVCEEHLMACD
jgi:hypothetical protein